MVRMQFLSRKMRQMIVAICIATVIQGTKVEEIPEGPRTSSSFHVLPELTYQILNADHLFLRDTSDVSVGNLSRQLQKQAFILTGLAGQPAMNVSYGPMSVEQAIPLELLHAEPRVRAFLLTRQLRSLSPVIRVLFYTTSKMEVIKNILGKVSPGHSEDGYICITVHGFWESEEVRGVCVAPANGGFCLANLTLEPVWFSPGSASWEQRKDSQRTVVEVYYQTRPSPTSQCFPQDSNNWQSHNLGQTSGQGSESNMKKIGNVKLLRTLPGNPTFTRLRLGGTVIVETSSKPLKTTDTATFSVLLFSTSTVEHFILRATAQKGMSFRAVRPSDSQLWDVALDPSRGTDPQTISVICQRRSTSSGKRGLLQVLQLDFESQEQGGQLENQIITWHLELPANMIQDEGTMRIYTVQKDYVGVAPLTMSTVLLNTAVLTGEKVSAAVTVLGVEADGSLTDITNLTRCRSSDESALKVSKKCDSLYLSGEETRGRVRMMVNFTYSYLSAQLEVSVWMPRLPLQVDIPDPELSQIKGWRVPTSPGNQRASWQSEEEDADERKGRGCVLQYQRSPVRVLVTFAAETARSGAPSLAYFPGAGWLVDVTRIVRYSLRVGDRRVARLQAGTVLSGRAAGVTTVQVLSPLSDSVLAERVVRVLDDKVSITELGVQLVSGLSLNLQLSAGSNRAIVATTTTQDTMYNHKQEAAVAFWVQFSDGSQAPLDLFDPSGYSLALGSLDERVASVRMVPGPVVVAEAEGQGLLLRAELAICDTCQKSKRESKLATGVGSVRVKFLSAEQRGGVRGRTPAGTRGPAKHATHAEPVGTESKVSLTSSRGLVEISRNTITGVRQNASREISTTSTKSSLQEPVGAPVFTIRSASNLGKPGTVPGTVGPASVQRNNYSDLTNNSVSSSREKKPKEDPLLEENNLEGPFFFTGLEFCIYSVVAVSCLAIIVFLLNCAIHIARSRSKKPPEQCQDPDENRHHWVRLSTAAEQGRPVPIATMYKQQVPSAAEMPRGMEKQEPMERPRGTEMPRRKHVPAVLCEERPAALGRSASLPPRTHTIAVRSTPAPAEPVLSEPLHSPTSKRKQVQFTTFTTLDIQHLAALKKYGLEFNWTSQATNEATGASKEILANQGTLCSHIGAANQRVSFQMGGCSHAEDYTEAKGFLPESPWPVVKAVPQWKSQ